FGHLVPCPAPGTGVFRIGRAENGDARTRPQGRQKADENLRSRRSYHVRDALRRVSLGGGFLQIPVIRGRRQPLEREGWQGGHRIGYGIDPRRQVDPRLGRLRKELPGLVQVAPMPDPRLTHPISPSIVPWPSPTAC